MPKFYFSNEFYLMTYYWKGSLMMVCGGATLAAVTLTFYSFHSEGRTLSTHCTGGWVDRRTDLEMTMYARNLIMFPPVCCQSQAAGLTVLDKSL